MGHLALAWRHLRKTPAFTIAAVLSIALGIGANTTVFSLVNAFLLRPLAAAHPEELVLFRAIHGAQGRMSSRGEGPGFIDPATGRNTGTPFSLLAFERLRAERTTLAEVFAFAPFSQVHVITRGTPESTVTAQYVSGTYYSALGVRAQLGRDIAADDDAASASPVAVISDRYWQTRFGGDPSVLGTSITINRVATTIVGVSPPGFDGAMQAGETADISVPLAQHTRFQPDRASRAHPWYWWVRIMGRLGPATTPAAARARLEPVFQQAAREGWHARPASEAARAMPDDPLLALDPGAQGENDVRRQYAGSLRILMGLVGLLLAAACANVANLLIVRGQGRRREIAVRMALGAHRRQIVAQLLVESLALASAGAALGLVLAWAGRDLLLALRPFGSTPVVLDLALDGRVLSFTLVTAVGTALIFGLAPALRATRVSVAAEFQGGPRALGGGRSRLSHVFMVIQVALSLVLLVSTGLFVRTLTELQHVDAGFDRTHLALFRIDGTSAGFTAREATVLHGRIQQRLGQLPGVRAATFSRVALLSRTRQNMSFSIPGLVPPADAVMLANTNGLAIDFFDVMRMPLVLGRGFTDRDDERAPWVAVVNQTFVRRYFGDTNPIGRHIQFSAPDFAHRVEVVGVARDAKYTDLRGATPATVYFPAAQQLDGQANFAIRTAGDATAIFDAIRTAVHDIDPSLPVLNLRTQDEQLDRLHGQERLFARLSGFFAVAAVALACVGIYGLLSHVVLRRRGELGLRIAVGALPQQVAGMVMRQAALLAGIGIAIGAAASAASGRLVATMLYGVSSFDALTYGVAMLVLMASVMLASFLPARQASRIEPVQALRAE